MRKYIFIYSFLLLLVLPVFTKEIADPSNNSLKKCNLIKNVFKVGITKSIDSKLLKKILIGTWWVNVNDLLEFKENRKFFLYSVENASSMKDAKIVNFGTWQAGDNIIILTTKIYTKVLKYKIKHVKLTKYEGPNPNKFDPNWNYSFDIILETKGLCHSDYLGISFY